MGLADLHKSHKKIIGVDASTNSFAFCLMDGDKVSKWGEIVFHGDSVYDRILDAKNKIKAIKGQLDYDFIAIEAAVSVRSVATGLKMAYIFGTIIGELMHDNIKVVEVHPITWQSYIGNKNFTKAEKEAVRKDYPGKSDNWYKAKIREIRKNKTIDFASEKGIKTDSDNVADSFGIAWYALNEIV
jgi:Holliday junction resolvasome RuvABC endonuclease subunit